MILLETVNGSVQELHIIGGAGSREIEKDFTVAVVRASWQKACQHVEDGKLQCRRARCENILWLQTKHSTSAFAVELHLLNPRSSFRPDALKPIVQFRFGHPILKLECHGLVENWKDFLSDLTADLEICPGGSDLFCGSLPLMAEVYVRIDKRPLEDGQAQLSG